MTTTQDGSGLLPLRPEDPREVAGYQLLRRIGEGGMGSVYLSRSRGGQPVALKVIRGQFAQDEEFRRRFQQEVQAARKVQGYHVVPVVDHDTAGTVPWLACRYVPGLALHDAIGRHGALPVPVVLHLVGCVAEALRAVHAAGVIHRDLKPSNILLGSNGPWVIDFGIARAADSTQLTASGGLIGTPQFMSPEHALGESLTPATDLFALGLIAAVAATGRHPYGDTGALTLATRIANTELRPPDLSDYPAELRPLLERCLAADPAARATPAELAALCEQAAGRSLREFDGWLPAAPAAEITSREAAAEQALAEPAPTAAPGYPAYTPTAHATAPGYPGYTPTAHAAQPTAPGYPGYTPTTHAAQGAQAAQPTTFGHPAYAPTAPAAAFPAPSTPAPYVTPFAPAPATPRRRTRTLVAAVAAAALVAGVGYAVASHGHGSHPTAGADHPAAGAAPSAQTSAPGQAAPPSSSPSPSATAKVRFGPGDVTVSSNDLDSVDLDATTPIAVPAHGTGLTVTFTSGAPYVDDYKGHLVLAKYPATGPAPSADDCAKAIDRVGTYNSGDISVGDRFCYKTPEDRIAYLVAAAVPSGIGPLRFTVTVWEQPG